MNGTEKDKEIKDSRTVVLAKIQKLTSALYLVTNFLSDSDPLKWKLRDKSLVILSQTNESGLFDSAIDSIGQLVSLIDVALIMPGVSQMNFSLLKKEFEDVRQKMLGVDSILEVGQVRPWESETRSLTPGNSSESKLKASSSNLKPVPNNSRRETILKFIKEHGWSPIKDIAQTMPEVSAKTVQRELAEMVQSGTLRKEGDRRWSRYHLSGN